MPAAKKVNPQVGPRDEATEGGIGTLDQVFGNSPEIQVGAIEVQAPPSAQGEETMIVRVNQDIDEMSIVAGGQRQVFSFETGHQYRVPVPVAQELHNLGKLWH